MAIIMETIEQILKERGLSKEVSKEVCELIIVVSMHVANVGFQTGMLHAAEVMAGLGAGVHVKLSEDEYKTKIDDVVTSAISGAGFSYVTENIQKVKDKYYDVDDNNNA